MLGNLYRIAEKVLTAKRVGLLTKITAVQTDHQKLSSDAKQIH